jgi:hypothetical protein
MAWTVETVTLDADKPDVGSVTMTWDKAGPDEFTYSTRAQVAADTRQEVLDAANAAKDAELTKRANEAALKTNFQAWLDAQ